MSEPVCCRRETEVELIDLGTGIACESLDTQVSETIREAVMLHVDKEAKVTQEICSQNRTCDVCKDEYPSESPAQSEIQCEKALSIRGDRGVVDSVQCMVVCVGRFGREVLHRLCRPKTPCL